MPTIAENLQGWTSQYKWDDQGEEWSASWGGSEQQWFGSLFPRIHAFLPATTILEIAPGFGRWTKHLKGYCQQLHVVDLSENCLAACRQRFAAESHIHYHLNDGRSLDMIEDNSIDFVFSFDSLVHVEGDVLQAYIQQLHRKLTPHGIGFIHHSNIGEHKDAFHLESKLPTPVRAFLQKRGYLDKDHWRAFGVTGRLFAQYCEAANVPCVSQELVNWETTRLIDCFSVFTRKGSKWARENVIAANPRFMEEAALVKQLSRLYSFNATT